jgi:hypothetical protein
MKNRVLKDAFKITFFCFKEKEKQPCCSKLRESSLEKLSAKRSWTEHRLLEQPNAGRSLTLVPVHQRLHLNRTPHAQSQKLMEKIGKSPASTSKDTTPDLPFAAAQRRGVNPSFETHSLSAPSCNSLSAHFYPFLVDNTNKQTKTHATHLSLSSLSSPMQRSLVSTR